MRLAILLALGLAGCATAPGPPVEVKIPVAVKCASAMPSRPTWADGKPAIDEASDIFALVQLVLAGRDQRDAYIAELEGATSGCR